MSGPVATLQALATRHSARAVKLVKFLAAGLPSFLVAVPLNWLLVEHAHAAKWLAYGLVQVGQVSVNFLACRYFVFEKKSATPVWRDFGAFVGGILAIRALDWGVYVLAVSVLGFPYLLVQLANVAVFGLLKFLFAERVLR